jgi:hypothetical protein
MPTYTFRRLTDGALAKQKLSFAQYDSLLAGDLAVTDDKGEVLELVFNPGNATFVLKDGPSGGWASKALKENKYRKERRQVMTKREKDHVFKTRLIPNYKGQEAETWAEARDEARLQQGEAVALTYEPLVAKEKAKK